MSVEVIEWGVRHRIWVRTGGWSHEFRCLKCGLKIVMRGNHEGFMAAWAKQVSFFMAEHARESHGAADTRGDA